MTMGGKDASGGGKQHPAKQTREQRRAAALRENLKRRKRQSRVRSAESEAKK